MLTHNVAWKNRVLDQALDAFDGGTLRIRSGAAPGAGNAATGTVLATVPLPADAFAAAAGGSKAKSGTWSDNAADATGVAGHFRLTNTGGTEDIEGTVGLTGSGADLEVDSVNFTAGQVFTITGFTHTL